MNPRQSFSQPAASPWRTFWIASAAGFLVLLDTTAVVAAYAPLRAHFSGVSVASLSWTLNAYTVLFAALLVPAGRLADLLGRKRLFLQGLAVFSAASALCALAPRIELLIAARALQAVGAALLAPASLALVLNAFPREKRASTVGLFSAVGALAAAVGPAFGSWVIEATSWRSFWRTARRIAARALPVTTNPSHDSCGSDVRLLMMSTTSDRKSVV